MALTFAQSKFYTVRQHEQMHYAHNAYSCRTFAHTHKVCHPFTAIRISNHFCNSTDLFNNTCIKYIAGEMEWVSKTEFELKQPTWMGWSPDSTAPPYSFIALGIHASLSLSLTLFVCVFLKLRSDHIFTLFPTVPCVCETLSHHVQLLLAHIALNQCSL